MSSETGRTLGHAVAEVQFAIEFGSLNERFWQRMETFLTWAQATAGALAFAGAFSEPRLLTAAGFLMAVGSAAQLVLQPGRRAIAFRDGRALFHDLHKRVWTMTLAEADAALEEIRKTAPQGIDALNQPALNRVEMRHGAATVTPLRLREKVALALA